MLFYRFKTFRTTYYFPEITKETSFLYGLYNPYGNAIIRIYWKLFKSSRIFRTLTSIHIEKLQDPSVRKLLKLCPKNSLISINMGTPGIEQKVSILGFLPDKKESFFAKYAEKEKAKMLAKNEIKILRELVETRLAPKLIYSVEEEDFIYFVTSRVNGLPHKKRSVTNSVIALAVSISKLNLTNDGSVKKSLSHGDFCPWNMLVENGKLRLIDWEMAAIRPLGYDLFLYILHSNLMMGCTGKYVAKLVLENQLSVHVYFKSFNIEDYSPYLKFFILDRIQIEYDKGNIKMVDKYKQIEKLLLSAIIE